MSKKGILSLEFDDRELRAFAKNLDGERLLSKVIHETGREVKGIIKRDVNQKYYGGTNWIGAAVGKPINGPLQSVIPVESTKGVIGQRFATTGSAVNTNPSGAYGFTGSGENRGWRQLRLRKGAKITAKIVKGKNSALPGTLPHQGGNPPFLHRGVVVTRRTENSRPVVRVAGLAVPQMITAQSKDDIMRDIIKTFEKNLDKAFDKL